ncbi:MAG: universal stress protein [Candidatus Promineifilaceae bacterium]|nr:universal stress protein [Candidatus Promineifilaceae bacterium]
MATESERVEQILCAVRGGPESRATVTYAIDLALETGARLTFFHALDAEFLGYATIGPLSVIYQELQEMGEFTMLILVDRAQRRGVEDVDYVVSEGNVREQLRQVAIRTEAEVMVMGRPTRSPGSNVFQLREIEAFAAELAEEGGLKLRLVPLEV